MSDQPTKAMSLREAVEVVSRGIPRLTLCEVPIAARIERDYMLALKIIDAAVEAHEAREAHECREPDPFGSPFTREKASQKAFQKLRALERGVEDS